MTAGARFGFLLVWVVVVANLMAWLVQYLSAKLGVVTGRSLPDLLGERWQRPAARRWYWLQAELVAMATDIAEVIGGAVALQLLFGLPLVWGGAITGIVSIGLLAVGVRRGARAFEVVIVGLVVIIIVGFTAGVFVAPPNPVAATGGLIPRFAGVDSLVLATSILGATIMPHAIYAHSALARDRFHAEVRVSEPGAISRLLQATRWDVSIAMVVAGTVNLCLLLVAAETLAGAENTDSLEGAYRAIGQSLGPVIATLFAVGLLASGFASTAVGAYAGGEIMRGLLNVRWPLIARRLLTLIPALFILAIGFDPTTALVLSQVVLSFGIPFALIPLVWLTSRRSLLGDFANRRVTNLLGVACAVALTGLNATLLWLLAFG